MATYQIQHIYLKHLCLYAFGSIALLVFSLSVIGELILLTLAVLFGNTGPFLDEIEFVGYVLLGDVASAISAGIIVALFTTLTAVVYN